MKNVGEDITKNCKSGKKKDPMIPPELITIFHPIKMVVLHGAHLS